MLIRLIMVAAVFSVFATGADAQGIEYVNPTVPGVPSCLNCNQVVSGPVDVGSSLVKVSTFNVGPLAGQPTPYNQESVGYVSLASILGNGSMTGQLNTRIDSAFAAIDATNTRISALNSQINRALELTAIAAAMGDAIPNPGDRFAIRLNVAALNGSGAGAISLSYNLNDIARVSVNYGQGRSQSIVSGGVNLSFR